MPVQTTKINNLMWIDITKPTKEDMQFLRETYQFHPLVLDDCLSNIQRPKVDIFDDYLFVILHFPTYDYDKRRLGTSEVDFFIGKDYVITIHDGILKPLNKFYEVSQKNEEFTNKFASRESGYLFYEIVNYSIDSCFPILDKITSNLENIETELFETDDNECLARSLLINRRDILNYRKILKPQRVVISTLKKQRRDFLPDELEDYFDDILDHLEKLWDGLENCKELVEGLKDTNETLISHDTRRIMRILTIISVIILPLTFITGIYGMNISVLPYAKHDFSFLIIVGFMVVVALSMFGYFKHRQWL